MNHDAQLIEFAVQGRAIVDDLIPNPANRPDAYRFLLQPEENIRRAREWIRHLAPEPSRTVFEIGPGCCYLLYLLREESNCAVAGIDAAFAKTVVYGTMRALLGLNEVVREHRVKPFMEIPFDGVYDFIIATGTVFHNRFTRDADRFWLSDCNAHLSPSGRMLIGFNVTSKHQEIVAYFSHFGRFVTHSTVVIEKHDLDVFLSTQE